MTESAPKAERRMTNQNMKTKTQRLLTAAAISVLLACCASAQVKD